MKTTPTISSISTFSGDDQKKHPLDSADKM